MAPPLPEEWESSHQYLDARVESESLLLFHSRRQRRSGRDRESASPIRLECAGTGEYFFDRAGFYSYYRDDTSFQVPIWYNCLFSCIRFKDRLSFLIVEPVTASFSILPSEEGYFESKYS